jgi:hypothetical protein
MKTDGFSGGGKFSFLLDYVAPRWHTAQQLGASPFQL